MEQFLLHTCCAPCSIAIIDELKSKFLLTVFFYNPNIFPEEEYLKRKTEVIKVCKEWGVAMVDQDNTPLAPLIRGEQKIPSITVPPNKEGREVLDYENDKWHEEIKGLENESEGGARCPVCFKMRLEKTAQFAVANNFQYFGTSLTMGKNKKADVIHPIGTALAKKYGIKFYEEDWKKKGRQEKGRKMVADRGIYRQNYCGCKYSMPIY